MDVCRCLESQRSNNRWTKVIVDAVKAVKTEHRIGDDRQCKVHVHVYTGERSMVVCMSVW